MNEIKIGLNGIIESKLETNKSNRKNKGKSQIEFPANYVVIDIETTGLDPKFDSIIEVAGIKISNGKEVDRFSELIKPDSYYMDCSDEGNDYVLIDGEKCRYVNEYITELTGITNQMLSSARTEKEVLSNFSSFIGENIIVGHNVNFDINFIYDALSNYNFVFNNDFVDTLRLSRRLLKDIKKHRLIDVAHKYNIDYSNAHRAINDCVITKECYIKLYDEMLQKFDSLDEFKKSVKMTAHKNLNAKDIVATIEDIDESNPLYGQVCVFTGTLEKMV